MERGLSPNGHLVPAKIRWAALEWDTAPLRPCYLLHELAAAAASFNTCSLSSVSDH